jgi:hypothetical protein
MRGTEHAELRFYRDLARLAGHFLDSGLASYAPAEAPA